MVKKYLIRNYEKLLIELEEFIKKRGNNFADCKYLVWDITDEIKRLRKYYECERNDQ